MVCFTALPRQQPDGVLALEVPEDVVDRLGAMGRAPVQVTLNGVNYRSTLAVYGGKHYLPVRREFREAAALEAGHEAEITLELDTDPRTITVPPDLAGALAEAGLEPAFASLSFTRRKEIVESVTGAKRAETRRSRIEKVIATMR